MNKMYIVANLASKRNNIFQLLYLSDKKLNKAPLISVADFDIHPPPSVAGLPPLCACKGLVFTFHFDVHIISLLQI